MELPMPATNKRVSVRTAIPSVSKEKTVRYGRTGTEVPPSSVRIRWSRYGHDTDEADGYGREGCTRSLAPTGVPPAGKLRPAQVVFLERIRAAGGVGFVARDCRDVLRELNDVEVTQ